MNNIDLELKLLAGEPIHVDESIGFLKPLTVREIVKEGYTKYLKYLNILTLKKEDLIGEEGKDIDLSLFGIILAIEEEEIIQEMKNAVEFFFKEESVVLKDDGILLINEGENQKIIYDGNFDKFSEVIKFQNSLKKVNGESVEVEATEKAKEIKEKLSKSREQIAMIKQSENDENNELDFTDILSSVSSMSNSINKLNVFDLTVYQLYDEFKRLDLIEQYDISIKSMLAGAKDVKLKHWSSKIDK